jgi:hypothetical protein
MFPCQNAQRWITQEYRVANCIMLTRWFGTRRHDPYVVERRLQYPAIAGQKDLVTEVTLV